MALNLGTVALPGYRKSACSGVTGVASTPTTPTTPTTPVVAPSTPATPTTQGMNRCGKDYNNAASKCGTKCPRGQDSECPSGEFCYAAIVDTLCGTTPTPPVVPPTTPTTPTTPTGQAPCDDGSPSACKSQCQVKCGYKVAVNQCWGSPRYIECKCTDGSSYTFTGCACENSQCAGKAPATPVIAPTTAAPKAVPTPSTAAPKAVPTPSTSTTLDSAKLKTISDSIAALRKQAAELNAIANQLEATLLATSAELLLAVSE